MNTHSVTQAEISDQPAMWAGYPFCTSSNAKRIITAAEMDEMTPQERAIAVDSAAIRSWDDVPEPFRSEVLAAASALGQQRRNSVLSADPFY